MPGSRLIVAYAKGVLCDTPAKQKTKKSVREAVLEFIFLIDLIFFTEFNYFYIFSLYA
jgi:hypothetical protein